MRAFRRAAIEQLVSAARTAPAQRVMKRLSALNGQRVSPGTVLDLGQVCGLSPGEFADLLTDLCDRKQVGLVLGRSPDGRPVCAVTVPGVLA